MVGIAADRLASYPHELSGGMRQRVMIAMALALEPQVVIMDEPTTALDVVTQREILEELMALRERLGFAVLFITHDLSLLVEIADSIAVMYAGRLVERAGARRPVPRAAPPVHARAAQLVPAAARAAPAHDRHPRLAAGPADAAVGLRVPPALPVRDGPLPRASPPPLLPAGPVPGPAPGGPCWLQDGEHEVPAELALARARQPRPGVSAPPRQCPRSGIPAPDRRRRPGGLARAGSRR